MSQHARGSFDVSITPQTADSAAGAGAGIGRMAIDKRFHGDLDATSEGEMLAVHTAVQGSAAYVALERVSGSLHGRQGSFVLQHSGTMTRGVPTLTVDVVPDSGTHELVGLRGAMRIAQTDGQHAYEFDYTLAAAP